MSSFYGGGSNTVINIGSQSFTDLTGTEASPVILSTLNYGSYLITGSYTYTTKDEDIKETSYPLLVTIIEDTVTSNKVAEYETCEDGVYYVYTITFYADETCLLDKQSLDNKADTVFTTDEEVSNSTGTSGILYVTETTIYTWSDDENIYIDLGAPVWSDIKTDNSSYFASEPEEQEVQDLTLAIEEEEEDTEEIIIP